LIAAPEVCREPNRHARGSNIIVSRPRNGVGAVPDYRVYTLGEDGHIKGRAEICCPDDEAALEHAKQLADGHAVELWERDRRIALVDGKDGSATPRAVRSATAAPNRS